MKIWKPEVFHGYKKNKSYFEGWYYKAVSENHNNILVVIPGIFQSKNKSDCHSFIQFFDGLARKSYYIRFERSDFKSSDKEFDISIADNKFNSSGFSINIDKPNFRAFGEIKFSDAEPWPIKFLSPGAMGWYGFVPFMECNHGILSMMSRVSGKMLIMDDVYIFTKDKGYMEKDWGASFPSSYIWLQSNHFNDDSISLSLSVAKIPWLFSSFNGFIIGLLYKNKLIRFTTYTGAKLKKLDISESSFSVDVKDNSYLLKVFAKRSQGAALNAPYNSSMNNRIIESLNSEVEIELYSIINNEQTLILKDKGRHSGIEMVGNLEELLI